MLFRVVNKVICHFVLMFSGGTRIKVYLDLCMKYGQLQPPILHTSDRKTTQIWWLMIHVGIQTFEVVVVVLLLLGSSFDVSSPQVHTPYLFSGRWFV